MSTEPFFVVNPNAANGKLRSHWPRIAEQAEQLLGPIAWRLTERQGHATELAREAARAGHRLVVSVGGDGTNNEVVNGLLEDDQPLADDLVLGFVPYGTGGDLRRSLGMTGDLASHLQRLREGRDLAVDIGRIDFVTEDGGAGKRYFLNIASAGISGLVDLHVNKSSKRLGGRVSFLMATLKALKDYKYPEISVQVDDGPIVTCPTSTVVVANACYFGGGMKVAPGARMDDGQFEVVVTRKAGLLDSAVGLRDLYRGEHLRHDFVSHQQGRVVSVQAAAPDEQIYLDVDGEVPGLCPATFTLLDKRLKLRVAPEA